MKHNLIRFGTVAAMAAGLAFAQAPATKAPAQLPPGHPMMQHRGEFRERMMQELNLSDSQKQEAKTIFQQARETAKPVRDELRTNREALQAAIKANDTAKIHSLSVKQGSLMAKLTEIRSDARAQFYAKLTPEQRIKADQMHQQMMERWQQRKGERTTGPTEE
jgi:Spy/CpxP family protein refolding chaperone